MVEIQNYSSFILAIIIFQLIPGAGTITILNATARKGVGCGMKAVLGTLSGDIIYMTAAVLGLAALLAAYPAILGGAQWMGAGYLCWIGARLLSAPVETLEGGAAPPPNGWAFFRQALAVSLTNPKVIMFFLAFFPLFLSPGSTPFTLVILMLHVTAISLIYQTLLVLAGNAVAKRLSRWQYARLIATRLAGMALIGFGIKLAFNNR